MCGSWGSACLQAPGGASLPLHPQEVERAGWPRAAYTLPGGLGEWGGLPGGPGVTTISRRPPASLLHGRPHCLDARDNPRGAEAGQGRGRMVQPERTAGRRQGGHDQPGPVLHGEAGRRACGHRGATPGLNGIPALTPRCFWHVDAGRACRDPGWDRLPSLTAAASGTLSHPLSSAGLIHSRSQHQ